MIRLSAGVRPVPFEPNRYCLTIPAILEVLPEMSSLIQLFKNEKISYGDEDSDLPKFLEHLNRCRNLGRSLSSSPYDVAVIQVRWQPAETNFELGDQTRQ